MIWKNRMIPGLLLLMLGLFMMNTAVLADETAPPPPAAASHTSASSHDAGQQVTAKAPAETPDARALSPEEVATLQSRSDSSAQNAQVQQMNVGATINTTVVLSVLVALVIFAILVAIL